MSSGPLVLNGFRLDRRELTPSMSIGEMSGYGSALTERIAVSSSLVKTEVK